MRPPQPAPALFRLVLLALLWVFPAFSAANPGTTFPFQGRLTVQGDSAFTGMVDAVVFDLYANEAGGAVVATLTRTDVPVEGGLFTVPLDFGESPAWEGGDRWLELTVEHDGGSETLTPRLPVGSSPYAIRARSATNADDAATLGGFGPGDFKIRKEALGAGSIGWFELVRPEGNLSTPFSWIDVQLSGAESVSGGGAGPAPVRMDHARFGFHAGQIPVELLLAGVANETVDVNVQLFSLGERDVTYEFVFTGYRVAVVGATLPGDVPKDQVFVELYCGADCESLDIQSDQDRTPVIHLDFQSAIFNASGAAHSLQYVHLAEGFLGHDPPEPPQSYPYRSVSGMLNSPDFQSGTGGGIGPLMTIQPFMAERDLDESLLQSLAFLVVWAVSPGPDRDVAFTAGTFRTRAPEDAPDSKTTPVLTTMRYVEDQFARIMRWRVHGSGAEGVTEEFDVIGSRFEFSVEQSGTEYRVGYNSMTNTIF